MNKSDYEEKLLEQVLGDPSIPAPVVQFQAVPTRKYTWDMGWEAHKLLLEVQGGSWSSGKSGHSSGIGIRRDAVKNSLAAILGYRVLVVTGDMVTHGEALLLIRAALLFRPADVLDSVKMFRDRNKRSRKKVVKDAG